MKNDWYKLQRECRSIVVTLGIALEGCRCVSKRPNFFLSYPRCRVHSLHRLSCWAFQTPFRRSQIYLYPSCLLLHSQKATRTPTFSPLPAVFARLPQILYGVPTLLHIQTKYTVYNVVRGATERKAEIRITPCWAPQLRANQTWRKLECRHTFP